MFVFPFETRDAHLPANFHPGRGLKKLAKSVDSPAVGILRFPILNRITRQNRARTIKGPNLSIDLHELVGRKNLVNEMCDLGVRSAKKISTMVDAYRPVAPCPCPSGEAPALFQHHDPVAGASEFIGGSEARNTRANDRNVTHRRYSSPTFPFRNQISIVPPRNKPLLPVSSL